jgi:predicted ATPase/DNA-binding SARP family transcriptional activator
MQVRVLGPITVGCAGDLRQPRGARPRDVLAVLLSRRGRPLPAEVILDLVWGDEAQGLTAAAVHTVVARLRRHLGEWLVETNHVGYLIPAGVTTDADRFTELATAAQEAELAGRPAEREALCRQALALWQGVTPYDGVPDELVLAERVRLEEIHRRLRADLAAALLASPVPGALDEALLLARDLVESNPLDEAAAGLLMRVLFGLQRQAEALEVFDRIRVSLRDELGVDPGPALRELHARLLAQDTTLAAEAPRTPLLPRRGIPSHPSPTIGREAEVASVIAALAQGRRLLTLTGPGGVGKSRVLLDVGADLASSGVEVVHVDLSGHAHVDTADQLASSVGLGAGLVMGGGDAVKALATTLRSADITVLVDEAEWVPEQTAEVAGALLSACPGVRLVISSRIPLSIVGERVVALEPLATADPFGTPDEIRRAPAVRLLAERLADRGGTYPAAMEDWPEQDLRLLAEVALGLDGLPLALEIAAGAASGVPLATLIELVRRPLDLRTDDQGRDARQQSLRHTITWSLARLGPDARTLLRRVSVFAAPFTSAAARAVSGMDPAVVDRELRTLTRDNLLAIERSTSTLSFRMLRTVRDLALEELREADEEDDTRARHLRWFAGLWRDAPLSDALIEQVSRTYDDHLEALRHALQHGNDPAAADLTITLSRRWMFAETPGAGLRWTEQLLRRPMITKRQRARLSVVHAALIQHSPALLDAADELAEALDGDPDWGFMLFLTTGIAAYGGGDPETALAYLDRCADLVTTGAPHHLPELIASRAVFVAATGDSQTALALARDALARVGPSSSAVHLVTVIPKAALAMIDAGRPDEALELLTRAAADASERFGIRPTSTTAVNAGWAALAIDQPRTALTWFRHTLVGPSAFATFGAIGEAAAGAGAALAHVNAATASELLGLGDLLLRADEMELPPGLAGLVTAAEAACGSLTPPDDWTPELAAARVTQLVREATEPD